MWTMRHGTLIAPGATVVQVDDTPEALGCPPDADLRRPRRRRAHRPRPGRSAAGTVAAATGPTRSGAASTAGISWATEPYDDLGGNGLIDPRTLTRDLDALLPDDRVVAVDSGNFMGYPAAYLGVRDHHSFCFTQAFQSIGLGLATAIGAAVASPGRLTVAALGDGGALMSAAELETVVRLDLDLLVVVYDDHAYGAEVHHFGPDGATLDTVVFPDTDLAAIARGFGFQAVTVRSPADLDEVRAWLDAGRPRPMLVDAKVADQRGVVVARGGVPRSLSAWHLGTATWLRGCRGGPRDLPVAADRRRPGAARAPRPRRRARPCRCRQRCARRPVPSRSPRPSARSSSGPTRRRSSATTRLGCTSPARASSRPPARRSPPTARRGSRSPARA